MPISDHYKGGQTEKMVVTIVTVDPEAGYVEGVGRDAAVIQISLGHIGAYFRMPLEREQWMIRRENGVWVLDSVLEVDQWPKRRNNLVQGQALITATDVFLSTNEKLAKDSELYAISSELDIVQSRLDAIEFRFYQHQYSNVNHSDGVAGGQNIQGFSNTTIDVTDANAWYRLSFQARTFQCNIGFNQNFGMSVDGAAPDASGAVDLHITIGYGGSGNIPLYMSFDRQFSVGLHTIRPWVNHTAGSGTLTIFAGMRFIVEQIT